MRVVLTSRFVLPSVRAHEIWWCAAHTNDAAAGLNALGNKRQDCNLRDAPRDLGVGKLVALEIY